MARQYESRTLRSTLRRMDDQIKRQGSASRFALSGLSVTGDEEVTMHGDFVVTGNFTAQKKINNEALVNPIRGDAALSSASGFALTTTGTVPLVSQAWFVPEGFTRAHVYITSRVFAINNTAGVDYLYARSRVYLPASGVAGFGNGFPIAATGNNGSALNMSPLGYEIVNLVEGDEVRLEVQGWTSFAGWAADASNMADVAGQITWTR